MTPAKRKQEGERLHNNRQELVTVNGGQVVKEISVDARIVHQGGACEEVIRMVYTAVIQRDGKWWIGWVEEVPGVNAQARTRKELLDDLRSALREALEMNRADALEAANGAYEEVSLQL